MRHNVSCHRLYSVETGISFWLVVWRIFFFRSNSADETAHDFVRKQDALALLKTQDPRCLYICYCSHSHQWHIGWKRLLQRRSGRTLSFFLISFISFSLVAQSFSRIRRCFRIRVGISIITIRWWVFFVILAFSVCFLKDTWTEKSRGLRLTTIRQKHEQFRHNRRRTRTAKRRRLQTDFKSESTNAVTTIINSYFQ